MNTVLSKKAEHYEFSDLLIILDGDDEKYALEVVLDAAETNATIINKAIVAPGGTLEMRGLIKMTNRAELGRADLTQKVLLLGKDAHATAIPELEIENNEVKANHAASVGQLDKKLVEYLMRRGFNQQQATRLLIQAFVDDVMVSLDEDKQIILKKRLEMLFEQVFDE